MIYHTVVADPPWQYKDTLKMTDGVNRSAMSHYKTLPIEKVRTFLTDTPASVIHSSGTSGVIVPQRNLEYIIHDDALLWLWVTNPFLLDGSAASVAHAWGFEPKALCTWVKGRLEITDRYHRTITVAPEAKLVLNYGMGRYLRGCTEHMMLCSRGRGASLIKDHGVPNVFLARRTKHSAKPQEAFDLVRRTSDGPYLSIFERTLRDGFDVIGDEIAEASVYTYEGGPNLAAVTEQAGGVRS